MLLKFQNFAFKPEVNEMDGNFQLQNGQKLLCRVSPSGQRPKKTHTSVSAGRFVRFSKSVRQISEIAIF